MEYFHLNEAPLNHDRRHNFQTSFMLELPFGPGKRFLNNGGLMAAVAGGWQIDRAIQRIFGGADDRQGGGHVAQPAEQYPDGGSSQT